MFEIIKLFVEQIMKVVNIKEIVKARGDSKLAALGVEMFGLYSSINKVLVCGLQIVDEIEDMVAFAERIKDEEGDWKIRGSYLSSLLREQARNIVLLSHSFVDMAAKIDVIDPDASRKMSYFLSTKRNFIRILLKMLEEQRESTFYIDTEKLLSEALREVEISEKDNNYRLGFNEPGVFERADMAITASDSAALGDKIPLYKSEIFKKYLEERQPRQQLEILEALLQDFHKVLTINFKIEDVLMAVGDKRIEAKEKYAAQWQVL